MTIRRAVQAMGVMAAMGAVSWAMAGPADDPLLRADVTRLSAAQGQALVGQARRLPALRDLPWQQAELPRDGSVRRHGHCLWFKVRQGKPVDLCDFRDPGNPDREPDSRTYRYLGEMKGRHVVQVEYMHDHPFLLLVDARRGQLSLVDPDDGP